MWFTVSQTKRSTNNAFGVRWKLLIIMTVASSILDHYLNGSLNNDILFERKHQRSQHDQGNTTIIFHSYIASSTTTQMNRPHINLKIKWEKREDWWEVANQTNK